MPIFSLSLARVSSDVVILLRRPWVSSPQTENTRSMYACEAGAASRSRAVSARQSYVARRSWQYWSASACCPGSCISIMYLFSCVTGISQPACDPVVVNWISAARNLKRLSAGTEVALSESVVSLVFVVSLVRLHKRVVFVWIKKCMTSSFSHHFYISFS